MSASCDGGSAVDSPLLCVRNLSVSYYTPSGPLRAVDGVSFAMSPGQILGLVGETGCGKSTIALSIVGLLDGGRVESGEILFEDKPLPHPGDAAWRKILGRVIGFVFQDVRGSLNPVLTVGRHLEEALRAHSRMTRREWRTQAIRLLTEVGIPDPAFIMRRFPLELSGGTCQRVAIALALCHRPRLLIADEPTSALDPTIQAQIIALLMQMRKRLGLAFLFISHDLALVASIAEQVAVMYGARIVESGPAHEVFSQPAHPYTRGLLHCVPDLACSPGGRRLEPIPGSPPGDLQTLQGCSFAPRCPIAEKRCLSEIPGMEPVAKDHRAACIKAR
jgi:oligopeptide/dipeptide ABC transporter ATP-binding protein